METEDTDVVLRLCVDTCTPVILTDKADKAQTQWEVRKSRRASCFRSVGSGEEETCGMRVTVPSVGVS